MRPLPARSAGPFGSNGGASSRGDSWKSDVLDDVILGGTPGRQVDDRDVVVAEPDDVRDLARVVEHEARRPAPDRERLHEPRQRGIVDVDLTVREAGDEQTYAHTAVVLVEERRAAARLEDVRRRVLVLEMDERRRRPLQDERLAVDELDPARLGARERRVVVGAVRERRDVAN